MKVKLSDKVFTVCPEGEHLFRISKVQVDEEFQVITLTLTTPDGFTDLERYQLLDSDGEMNDGAVGAFSILARSALQMGNIDEIDPKILLNHYIKATVSHTVKASTKKVGQTVTFTSISNIGSTTKEEYDAQKAAQPQAVAQQSTNAPKPAAPAPASVPKKTDGKIDLDALFGRK